MIQSLDSAHSLPHNSPMGNEDRVRARLRKTGLDKLPWIDLLAVNLMPDPTQWITKGRLWKFLPPKWLRVNLVTGNDKREVNNYCYCTGALDFGDPGFVSLENSGKKIELSKIRRIELNFIDQPKWRPLS